MHNLTCRLTTLKSKLPTSLLFRNDVVKHVINIHFHMSAIAVDISRQRELSIELWKKWRAFFDNSMGNTEVVIEICDYASEVIVYLYQNGK